MNTVPVTSPLPSTTPLPTNSPPTRYTSQPSVASGNGSYAHGTRYPDAAPARSSPDTKAVFPVSGEGCVEVGGNVCVCVCECERERQKEGERGRKRMAKRQGDSCGGRREIWEREEMGSRAH